MQTSHEFGEYNDKLVANSSMVIDRQLSVLRTRRSTRRFLPESIPQDLLAQVLEAATWAPSAHNRQPWRFAVLTSPEIRHELARVMGDEYFRDLTANGSDADKAWEQVQRSHQRIQSAPVGILVCLDTTELDVYPDLERQSAEMIMGIQSVAMAGQNLLLAANILGLAGVWICAPLFSPQAVRQVLQLPESWSPQGLILLGFPAAAPRQKKVKSVAEVTRFY